MSALAQISKFLDRINTYIGYLCGFFALNHHLLNGLKYFLWTFAKGMELNQVYLISYCILIINLIMTAIFAWSIF